MFLVVGAVAVLVAAAAIAGVILPARPLPPAARSSVPVLAYYYIWYGEDSWSRAKIDFPELGRYSSDEQSVMEQHVKWAKAAGIEGFIVSWKSTPKLDARLRTLVEVARAQHFKLSIIYQGLDFDREPLPIERVESDLRVFARSWKSDPVFDMFDRPVVAWSGTWLYSAAEVARVSNAVRPDILLLGTERDPGGVERLKGVVDGNAYYWSSVNPATFPDYPGRLRAMANAVHSYGGLWFAPAAPGFDARLVGGTSVVERLGGETLRTEIAAAADSNPDAIAIISWNEFSENSHIEPSDAYGHVYLDAVQTVTEPPAPAPGIDSDEDPGQIVAGVDFGRILAGTLLTLVLIGGAVVILRRSR